MVPEMAPAVTKTKKKRSRKQDCKPDKPGEEMYVYYRIRASKYYLEICSKYIFLCSRFCSNLVSFLLAETFGP